ncbi:MAG: hypothetical protein ACU0BF_07590 [Paracoccaceae bacterium]
MRAALIVLVALSVAGCARIAASPLNPLNLIRGVESALAPADQPLVPASFRAGAVDARVPVARLTGAVLEPTATGALLRATGLGPADAFNLDLVPVAGGAGALTFDLRAETRGAAGQRAVTVARAFTFQELAGVGTLRVRSATNQFTVRR